MNNSTIKEKILEKYGIENPTYNQLSFYSIVNEDIDNKDDFCYVVNMISRILSKNDDPCKDNFRFCHEITGRDGYMEQKRSGCCGYEDHKITNPKTNNIYLFGFNYGH
jgi:hypothetical protein